ncbi:DNA-directed RNA polymerase subunit omega [Agrobacterium sp. FDAARGOS_525]|uniref:DNA-directed RNA polymerase subunit omega n=1 Tax=Agrobacterium sp. FDAARGOS_525 TaxID=2420311 RepID=UPI000F66CA34|nr:DNA-directed RNA polymerase subunit omega [Agrobacterium sp. FDAARGOS_525]RSC30035.1 DNA-directed RNA polymerase subunit omega [Agrobacterium sp. FDAARGOS_525]
MDPHVVFDCQEIVPNRFVLTIVAAARARALNRGAEARVDLPDSGVQDLALREVAKGAFSRDELAPFLPALTSPARLTASDPTATELRGDGAASAAAAPRSSAQETVH